MRARYAKGIKVSKAAMDALRSPALPFHPEWNDTIKSRSKPETYQL